MTEQELGCYLNRTQDVFESDLERFLDHLRSTGNTDCFIQTHERCIRYMHRLFPHDPDHADGNTVKNLEDIVSSKSERARRDYVRCYGRFLNFLTRRPIYHEYSNKGGAGYYLYTDISMDSFEGDISRYVVHLREHDGAGSKVRTQEKYVRHCMKLLSGAHGSVDIHDVTVETIDELRGLMTGVSESRIKGYLGAFGRFILFVTGTNPYRECNRSVLQRDFNAYLERKIVNSRFPLDLRRYLEWLRKRGIKDSTLKSKFSGIHNCTTRMERLRPGFTLDSVGFEDIVALRMDMSDLKESSARQNLYQFGAFIGFVTGTDPYKECPLMWNNPEPDRIFIHQQEWRRLLAESDVEERLVISLSGGMGLRRAEMSSIRLSDIDFKDQSMIIHGKGHGVEGKVQPAPIPLPVMEMIKEYMVFRQNILNIYGDHSEGFLLVKSHKYHGERMIPDNVGDIVYRLAKRCGITMSTHVLRRLYATMLYKVNTDINTIRVMMRHCDVKTTLQCYVEADTEKRQNAQDALSTALFA